MGDAVIGALRVSLALDAGEFSKGADKARARATTLQKEFGDVAKYIGGAFAALEIGEMLNKQFDKVTAIARLSEQTGIATASLSQLVYAAQLSDVSLEELSGVITRFNRQLVDMSRDSAAPAAQALATMGISAFEANGRLKNFDTLLLEVADKFATYENGANKSALATAIFGRNSAQLIELLNRGSAGIREAGDEARKFGLVLDEGTARQMREAEEASKRLAASWEGLVQQTVIGLGPALTKVANVLANIIASSDSLNRLSTKELSDQIDQTNAELEKLYETRKKYETSTTGIGWVDTVQMNDLEWQIARTEKKLQEFNDEWEKRLPHIEIKLEAPKLDVFEALKTDLDQTIEKLNGMPVLLADSFNFDTKPFETAMRKVEALREMDVLSAKQAAQFKLNLQKSEQAAILDTATVVGDSLVKVFAKSKLAASAQAAINTAVGITKALALEGPLGWIQAAAIAAAGAAQLATINAASATAGASSAPSPTGSAPAASADTGAAAPATQPQTIFIEGINPSGLFSGQAVRELIQNINQAVADGAKLVLK